MRCDSSGPESAPRARGTMPGRSPPRRCVLSHSCRPWSAPSRRAHDQAANSWVVLNQVPAVFSGDVEIFTEPIGAVAWL